MRRETFHQRVVAGTAATLSWQQIGTDGEPANPGTVTVTVTRADGTATATAAATTGTGTAARTYALTQAQTAQLDTLTAAWKVSGTTIATTRIDVVAAPWFSNDELRSAHPDITPVARTAAQIAAARQVIENQIERITRRRFTPGFALRWLPGTPSGTLVIPDVELRSVRSAALYARPEDDPVYELDAAELAGIRPDPSGLVCRSSGTWSAPWVRIGYEFGFDTCPGDMKRAAMRLTHDLLVKPVTTMPDQAQSWNSQDLGWSAIFVTPGIRGAHTSIPWVNEILDDWTFDPVAIG